MKPSMEPTRISDRTASRAAVTSSTTTATVALQAGPAWPAGSPCPPRVSVGLRELVHERQDVADDERDRRRGSTPRSASPGRARVVVSAKTAGTNRPMTATTRRAAFAPAMRWLNVWVPWRSPPMSTLAPSTSSRLPMIEPVSEALTTSMRPACRAKKAMISSAMLPNVALRMPPTCGPVSDPSRSVDSPTTQARPRIADAGDDEHDRVVGADDDLEQDGHDADRERPEQEDARDRPELAEDRDAATAGRGGRRVGRHRAILAGVVTRL